MNKAFLLMAEYEESIIPLEKVCLKYFGLNIKTARERAKAGTLPVPAFKLSESQGAPWLISVESLAKALETQEAEQKRKWTGDLQ